jgi:hypothetical protein
MIQEDFNENGLSLDFTVEIGINEIKTMVQFPSTYLLIKEETKCLSTKIKF